MTTTEPECDGLCVNSSDLGVPGYGIAYPHPGCPLHDPGNVCRCGTPERCLSPTHMTTTWRTLTFSDLRPGDTVKLDEEGPEETVTITNAIESPQNPDIFGWFTYDDQWLQSHRYSDPVLVRFPRPEVEA